MVLTKSRCSCVFDCFCMVCCHFVHYILVEDKKLTVRKSRSILLLKQKRSGSYKTHSTNLNNSICDHDPLLCTFFCSVKHSLCCRHFYDIHCSGSGSQASSGASWCTPFHPLISAFFLHTTFSTRSRHVETVSKFTKSLYDLSVLKRRESWFLRPSSPL